MTLAYPDVPEGTIGVHSPRGRRVILRYREGTTDLATIGSTFRLWGSLVDEYGLADIHSDGLLVDVGAHVGSVAIAYLVDNPGARAVAIEPLPENVAIIRESAELAGVADRLTIRMAAIGTDTVAYGPDVHRYIGNIGTAGPDGANVHGPLAETVPVLTVSLADIPEPIDILKTDCEGCEWSLLTDPAIASIPLIVGEYHHRGPQGVKDALSATHDVTADSGPTGNFRAVLR